MRPRLRRAIPFILVPLLGLLMLGLPLACRQTADESGQYYCPMHPEYHSDKPGDCPICGMRLVMTKKKDGKDVRDARGVSDSRPEERRVSGAGSSLPDGLDVPGLARIEADAPALRLAGVQTAVAERRTFTRSTRAVGLVAADESRVRHVHTKVSGWVEKLYVNTTGQPVRAGQPLLAIYSPELLATQEEYLRAREAGQRFAGSALPEVRRGGEDLIAAARRRLELFDAPRSLISRLDETGQPQRTVTLLSPASGYVTGKEVFEGMEVGPGFDLMTITDLSRIWVEADFYEYESRSLAIGQRVAVQLPYDPGAIRRGRISFVYPFLQPESRTVKVRIELTNPGLQLKPGMYVDVMPELAAPEGVVIPDSAVIDTGVRQVVFVRNGDGFAPRQVRIGGRGDGQALVLEGLQAGERVAVRANFLLDSESRLRAAVAGMKESGHQHGGAR